MRAREQRSILMRIGGCASELEQVTQDAIGGFGTLQVAHQGLRWCGISIRCPESNAAEVESGARYFLRVAAPIDGWREELFPIKSRMDEIGDWIRKLKREVEIALSDERPLPPGARLEANRVTLSLALSQGEPGTRLTIEFEVRHPASAAPPAVFETLPVQVDPDALRALIIETGAAVFGPGGFDNSARAEVFCELVGAMEPADVIAALLIIEGQSHQVTTNRLEHPVARLRQILGFSALGSELAARRLRELLEQSSVLQLTTVLGEEWRFGTHWPQPSSS